MPPIQNLLEQVTVGSSPFSRACDVLTVVQLQQLIVQIGHFLEHCLAPVGVRQQEEELQPADLLHAHQFVINSK